MVYLAPSSAGEFFQRHVDVMVPCHNQECGQSFAIAKEGYSLQCLRDIADTLNVGTKAYVVIEHEDSYEVRRLYNGMSVKLFYRYLNCNSVEDAEANKQKNCLDTLKNLIEQYKNLESEDCLKYDPIITNEFKARNCISYAYIQRRLASVSAFRNSQIGAKESINLSIEQLIVEGLLEQLIPEAAKKFFDTTAKIYVIKGIENENDNNDNG